MQHPICTIAITSSGVSTRSIIPHSVGPNSESCFTDIMAKITVASSCSLSLVWGISIILRYMMSSNTLVSSIFFTLFALSINWLPCLTQAQISWDFAEPIAVAGEEFGNLCPRLVLDASGNPMVLMGKSGEGLFLATSDNGVFNTPLLIPTLENVFMADAEGPSIAVHGATLGLTYQVSGEWATGGQYMSTQDGGQTWSESFPISPDATEDHFMPILAFDDDGNPFVAVKFGDDPMVVEGVMRSTDGGQTFQPAQPASADVGSGLACECCPSKTIFGHGRYYSVYRQNDENLRDMRLVSSEDGATWDHQLDLDPTDWVISACPETGASLAWLPDGRLASTFRSSGNGASKVYVNFSDVDGPMSSDVGATVPVTNFAEAGNQDQPHIACGPTHTVVVWQENSGGWEIHVASSANDALQRDCPTKAPPSAPRCQAPTFTQKWPSTAPRFMSFGRTAYKRSGDVLAGHVGRCRAGGI